MECDNFPHPNAEPNPNIMSNLSLNLYKSSWTDLVFKNRNKAYGAYQLRAESSSITLRALLIAAPLFIVLFAGPAIYKRLQPEVKITEVTMDMVLEAIPPAVDRVLEKKIELPKADPAQLKPKTVKMTANIQVVDQPQVDETPPMLDDLQDAVVGQSNQSGATTSAVATPGSSSGNAAGNVVAVDNTVYNSGTVEQYPEFEGGMAAWGKFIQRNLRYPEMAIEKETQGKVFVSFVVERDGSITDVSILKGIGNGCDEEAMRVIKKSPRWKPGLQHNTAVRVRYTMPLSFMLGN